MGGLKINGKGAVAASRKVRTAPPRVHPVDAPIDWNDPYADPFPTVDDTPVEQRVSWLGDMGLWAQQMIEDAASLARKLDKLTRKLEDPKLAGNEHRPDAVQQARQMDVDLQTLVRDIQWHEAHCDRTWVSLTRQERQPCAGHWHTPAKTPRLIGASFQRIGCFETWPRGFRCRRAFFQDFPPLLVRDMKEAGLWSWKPSGADPPDPFGGETFFSATLAQELHERT